MAKFASESSMKMKFTPNRAEKGKIHLKRARKCKFGFKKRWGASNLLQKALRR